MIDQKRDVPRTIGDLENALAAGLTQLAELQARGSVAADLRHLLPLAPPPGFAVTVSLRHRENDRQIKRSASTASWSPESCGVWIEYVPVEDESADRDSGESVDEVVCSLIRTLDVVERQPRKFTSWTWLRDQYLPSHGWTLSKEQTQLAIERATASGVLTTRKVPNPKQPDYPVTSLELNREHPIVRETLGATGLATRFQPVRLPGVPLSDIVLQDRR